MARGIRRTSSGIQITFANGYTVDISVPLAEWMKDQTVPTVKPSAWTPGSSTFLLSEMDPEMLAGWLAEVSKNPPIKVADEAPSSGTSDVQR